MTNPFSIHYCGLKTKKSAFYAIYYKNIYKKRMADSKENKHLYLGSIHSK